MLSIDSGVSRSKAQFAPRSVKDGFQPIRNRSSSRAVTSRPHAGRHVESYPIFHQRVASQSI